MSGKSKVVPGGDLAKVMRACCMISNSTATLAVFSCRISSQLRYTLLTESKFCPRVLKSKSIDKPDNSDSRTNLSCVNYASKQCCFHAANCVDKKVPGKYG